MGNKGQRFAELDGIRGVGATLVVLGHTRPDELFWAVTLMDIFFVFSAFMVGRLVLLKVHSFKGMLSFFQRRIERLWPVYMLVIVGIFAGDFLLAQISQTAKFDGSSFWRYITFSQFSELLFHDRFSYNYIYPAAHTWSLAVEEQFYILFPTIVLLCTYISRSLIFPALVSLVLLGIYTRMNGAFFSVLTFHIDAFACGGLLALCYPWLAERPVFSTKLFQWMVVFGLFGFCYYTTSGFVLYFSGYEPWPPPTEMLLRPWLFLIILLWTGIIGLVAVNPESERGRFWRKPGLVYLGLISYPLYMVHLPILVASEKLMFLVFDLEYTNINRNWSRAVSLPLVFLAAHILYVLIDKRVQQKGTGFIRKEAAKVEPDSQG